MSKMKAALTAAFCATVAITIGLASTQQTVIAADHAIGTEAPAFKLPDVKTGDHVELANHKGKVVVLMFHSIGCPWYRMREEAGYDRVFVKMAEDYKDKQVVFLGINSNKTDPTDKIKKYVEKHNINYTVVKDEGNKIADAYGAKVTPHVFVVDQAGKLRYRGGVEERPANPNACGESKTQYLGPVIDALLNGSEPPVTETEPVGCGIKRV